MTGELDVLMVTYDRPSYTRQSLARLLDTADERTRVWVWHNGSDEPTLSVVRSFAKHPRLHTLHHSPTNKRLRVPTNWVWENGTGDYVSKVDDDCLVTPGWSRTLIEAHEDYPGFGVLACWRFQDDDFAPELSNPKIAEFAGVHQVLQNLWVQGSSYVIPRRHIVEHGTLRPRESFTQYCKRLALAGLVNGWYYPFIKEDHMDDPRSLNTGLLADADLLRRLPLSAEQNGVSTLDGWDAMIRRTARRVQAAPLDPGRFRGVRRRVRNARRRAGRLVTHRHW